MALVPSLEAEELISSAEELLPLLEVETGLHFEAFVAPSYVGIVEAMSIDKVHVAWLPPMAYVFASERNNDRVILKVVRDGKSTYRGQVVVLADSDIESIADLKGRRVAFVEQGSSSGYLYPRTLLADGGVSEDDLGEVKFAGSHDAAVLALLNDSVDAACSFEDVREKLMAAGQTDIMEKTRVLAYTPEIPADNVAIFSGMDAEMEKTITAGLLAVMQDEKGAQVLYDLYDIEGLEPATDSDYDPVRQMAAVLGINVEEKVKELGE
jgi:phosphonate transport system substrate-binding protein